MTPGMPFMAVSIGKVTSSSTSSGARPSASAIKRDGRPVEVGEDVDGQLLQRHEAVEHQRPGRR